MIDRYIPLDGGQSGPADEAREAEPGGSAKDEEAPRIRDTLAGAERFESRALAGISSFTLPCMRKGQGAGILMHPRGGRDQTYVGDVQQATTDSVWTSTRCSQTFRVSSPLHADQSADIRAHSTWTPRGRLAKAALGGHRTEYRLTQ